MAEINDLLIPLSLTQAEINAITNPDDGSIVFNSTTNRLQEYHSNTSSWISAVFPGDDISELNNDAGFVNASQASGNAPIQSVFGRTGNISSQLGDYDASQINMSSTAQTVDNEIVNLNSEVTNLTNNKRDKTAFRRSLEDAGGDLQLVNDLNSPPNNSYYGTNNAGQRGYHTLPSANFASLSDLAISQGNLVQNVLTAATLTSNVNNWNPTGFNADTDMIRVNVNANQRSISGIIAPAAGVNRILAIKNINTASLDLRFVHNSSNSLPANRFLVRDNNSKSIKPNDTALWFYDHVVSRWTPFSRIG